MGYTLHTEHSSKNFTPGDSANAVWGQGNRKVQGIVIHHWGVTGQDFWGVVNFLCVNTKPTSAHYVVQENTVACIVSPWDSAWHAGHPWANSHLIGLELRPEATAGDKRTAAELIAQIRKDYNDPNLPLTPHNKWQSTACPGVYDLAELDRMARAIWNGGATAPAPAPAPVVPVQNPTPAAPGKTNYVPDPHWLVEPGETLGQVAAHYGLTVAQLAAYNGIANPNAIKVGERIWPCSGRDTWIVDPGDTLASIGKFYGLPADRIAFTNGINDPTKLTVGLRLNIPR